MSDRDHSVQILIDLPIAEESVSENPSLENMITITTHSDAGSVYNFSYTEENKDTTFNLLDPSQNSLTAVTGTQTYEQLFTSLYSLHRYLAQNQVNDTEETESSTPETTPTEGPA